MGNFEIGITEAGTYMYREHNMLVFDEPAAGRKFWGLLRIKLGTSCDQDWEIGKKTGLRLGIGLWCMARPSTCRVNEAAFKPFSGVDSLLRGDCEQFGPIADCSFFRGQIADCRTP